MAQPCQPALECQKDWLSRSIFQEITLASAWHQSQEHLRHFCYPGTEPGNRKSKSMILYVSLQARHKPCGAECNSILWITLFSLNCIFFLYWSSKLIAILKITIRTSLCIIRHNSGDVMVRNITRSGAPHVHVRNNCSSSVLRASDLQFHQEQGHISLMGRPMFFLCEISMHIKRCKILGE